MALVLHAAMAAAESELARLHSLDRSSSLQPDEILAFVSASRSSAPAVPLVMVTKEAATSPSNASASARGEASLDSTAAAPLSESERAEMRRYAVTLQDMAETNDRIMAQNIALLADLEVAQRAVRELRTEKDALAVQLRRLLSTTR